MNHPASQASIQPQATRREFIKTTGRIAAVSALAGVALPHVHAAEDNTVRLAIIGCGPRGTGAVGNAFSAPDSPFKLVAMADLFDEKLQKAHGALTRQFPGKMDVPSERQFIGFDAYKKAMDCIRPGTGDIAMLTTRAAFRPTHFKQAVARGLNVFMEKSFAADAGGIKQLLKTNEEALAKGLKVACGFQCRHSTARQALIARMRNGDMGDIIFIRAYRLQSGGMMGPHKPDANELLWQIRQPVALLWSSGGTWMENMIHQVDECCWIKDSWPVSAHGMGGRAPWSTDCSQNFDNYTIEYTFADGAKALVQGRFWPGCYNEFATFAHGTRCAAQFSGNVHAATVHTYNDQRIANDNIAWQAEKEACGPWDAEWRDFLDAIRKNQPYNELKRAALSNLVSLMGRAAVHSGRIVTWEEATSSTFRFCDVDALTPESKPPFMPDAQGRYPAPIPGKWSEI
ncbi:MAG: Gfo/Idh/MocA family oxidoreductase [Verrucomicrobia bacterium]|nr:Gfo/Idh/MocA family oxidoreductase [Verrucomicrobiota bacterium]